MKKCIATVLSTFLFATTALFGQYESAELLGTVSDPSTAPMSQVTVTLTSLDTGLEAKTTTSTSGEYNFFHVKPGRYAVSFEAAGFSKTTAPDVVVSVGARQRVDVTMQVGAVTEAVNVSGAASALETDSSEHGQVINPAAMVELPLNGRNYAELALLSTGTVIVVRLKHHIAR